MPLFQEPDITYQNITKPRSVGEFRATIIEETEVEKLLGVLNKKFTLTGDLSPIFPFLPAAAMEKLYGNSIGILLDADLTLFPQSFVNNIPSGGSKYFADDKRVTRYYDTTNIPIPIYVVENYEIRNGWIYAHCAYGDECCFPVSALSKEPKEFWKILQSSHITGKGPKNTWGDGYFEVENNTITLYNSSGKKTQTLVGSACVIQNAQGNILQIADGTKLKTYDMTPDGGGFQNIRETSQSEIDISALGYVFDIWIDNKRNFYIFASQIGEKKLITIAPMRPKGKSQEGQQTILPIAQFEADTILEVNDINDIVCIRDGRILTINTHFNSLETDFSGVIRIERDQSIVCSDNTLEILSEEEHKKMLGIKGGNEGGSIEKGLGFLKEQGGKNHPLQDLMLEIKRVFEEVMRRISTGYGSDLERPRTIHTLWLCRGYRVRENFFTVLDTELGLIGNALLLRHSAGEKIPSFIVETLADIRTLSDGLKRVIHDQYTLPKESLTDFKDLEKKIGKLLQKIQEFLKKKDFIIQDTRQKLSLEEEIERSSTEMARILRIFDEAKSHIGDKQRDFSDYSAARNSILE